MQDNQLLTMVDHQAWADDRLCNALIGLNGIHEKSKKLFDHILAAQHVWISRIEQKPAELEVWPVLAYESWPSYIRSHHQMLTEIIQNNRLREMVTYQNTAGQQFSNSVAEILMHLTLHSQYHRGQVISYSLEKFEKAPVVDMIAYLRTR